MAHASVLPAGTAYRHLVTPDDVGLGVTLDARRFRFEDAERLARKWRSFVPTRDDSLELYGDALKMPVRRLDARLEHAIEQLEAGASVATAAKEVRLSESRLTHLFAERFGTPPRTWRAWLLLRGALFSMCVGSNAARAAQIAGFADAAHFTRTCRAMLGLTPTTLATSHIRFMTDRMNVLDGDKLRVMGRAPEAVTADVIKSARADKVEMRSGW